MSFLVVYSLVLATVFTMSFAVFSCSYCLSHCNFPDEEEEDIPECVLHMYS